MNGSSVNFDSKYNDLIEETNKYQILLKRYLEILDQKRKLEISRDVAIKYIKGELLQGDSEYYRKNKNDVVISGSDMMAYEIIDLLEILEDSNE